MTLSLTLVTIGAALAVLGLIGLGVCVFKALAVRRGDHGDQARSVMERLVALNMASVGIAFIGLALIVTGLIF